MKVIVAIPPACNTPMGNTQATTQGPQKKLEMQAWKIHAL